MVTNPFPQSLLTRGLRRSARTSNAPMLSRTKRCVKRAEERSAGVLIAECERTIETRAPPGSEPAGETP